jgi:hypothetical protein
MLEISLIHKISSKEVTGLYFTKYTGDFLRDSCVTTSPTFGEEIKIKFWPSLRCKNKCFSIIS